MGYLLWPHINNPDVLFWYFSQKGNIYYGKIVWMEILNTFTFVVCYLLIIYKPSLRTVDELIKGIGIAYVLWICYFLSAGSGACLNPALGLAQTTFQVGFLNGMDLNGNGFASLLWVYMVMPFVGAILAALFFRMHISMDAKALNAPAANAPAANVVAA